MSLQALELTEDNYYSLEANRAYMSNSLLKEMRECPAKAIAKRDGLWIEEPSDALLVGNYVHTAVESDEAHAAFKEANHDFIYNKKGELYAPFKQASKMIESIWSDEFISDMLTGVKEFVITTEFAGTMWKAKLDVYNPGEGRIVDLKTVKFIRDKHWSKELGQYVSFVEAYGYLTQLALYTEFERRFSERSEWLTPIIVAVSKEDVPDKAVIGMDDERIQYELERVQMDMEWILPTLNGVLEPRRCESCKFCRETKRITRVMHYSEVIV